MYTLEKINSVGEVELYFKKKHAMPLATKVSDSAQLDKIFRQLFSPESINHRESSWMICFDAGLLTCAAYRISEGGITSNVVDVRLVFQAALLCNAVYFAVAHNHPSGRLIPSDADVNITKTLQKAGQIMQIKLLDHLIITDTSYYSFADNGKL